MTNQVANTSQSVTVAVSSVGDLPSFQPVMRPIPRWVIAAGVPVMVLVAAAAVWVLLESSVGTAQLDAIRTGGTLGVGLGGVVALWLAIRKQRSTELDLVQKHNAHRLAERTAAHNEKIAADSYAHQLQMAKDASEDAISRRIAERYSKAVEQLGSDQAIVRLGGLYALENLAQENLEPSLRQTVVNVICAYLRVAPVEGGQQGRASRPLGRRPVNGGKAVSHATFAGRRSSAKPAAPVSSDEHQVRLAAQRILASHLRPGAEVFGTLDAFWSGMDLDLSDAFLVNVDFSECHIRNARFCRATFCGEASFGDTVFLERAEFDEARFDGNADFENSVFEEGALFGQVEFMRLTGFYGAEFAGYAGFESSLFMAGTSFTKAKFGDGAEFGGANFAGFVSFDEVKISRGVGFEGAESSEIVEFNGAELGGDLEFRRIKFARGANFMKATLCGDAARLAKAIEKFPGLVPVAAQDDQPAGVAD
ncbi:pentapeptide repeat-containing protein [Amycolatopsis sp. NPDC059021]|uniref:pentapeptide repeat-containing protein n=1 Tax=Amycolatopsis sp. NPDC059021 TaxID=3346704 RepID=UPI0036700FBC